MEDLYIKTLCGICLVKEKNMALIPCGHVYCEDCISHTMTAICPYCRREYTDKLVVIF